MPEAAIWVDVLVDIEAQAVDRLFSYAVPAGPGPEAVPGVRVLVPFGPRRVMGWVIERREGAQPPAPLKEIIEVLDREPVFTGELWQLAGWLAERYLCTRAPVMHCMLPPVLRGQGEPVGKLQINFPPGELAAVCASLKRARAQAACLSTALQRPGLTRTELARAAGVGSQVVGALLARGLLAPEAATAPPSPGWYPEPDAPLLNGDQAAALAAVEDSLSSRAGSVKLLYGVTGSGKTEVYLRAAAAALSRGRQALILVPEIALTPQMVERFTGRFGPQVALWHSRLAAGERYRTWRSVMAGEKRVVLGTRSAVFAPLPDPGLIVLDEEHELTYKQEDQPRYHARVVAGWRAARHGAVLLLGSATPSLESYRLARAGRYALLTLPVRVDDRPLPVVNLVDLRDEVHSGRTGLFSAQLLDALQENLERGAQSLLFLNRRGFHTFLVCRRCGTVVRCSHCAISLVYHRSHQLKCHYCNHTRAVPDACPDCGGQLQHFGAGTERVEEEVQRLFPQARVLRMDADTTSRKGAHGRILAAFAAGEADILVGTQMIAKGLDLPRVTLVGVVSADQSLHMPDFRAAERTFQLLTQVAGRAGRGGTPGTVIAQTYNPDHYSVRLAAAHDFPGFWTMEAALRKQHHYPPFGHLIRVVLADPREETAREGAAQLAQSLQAAGAGCGWEILGPAPAPVTRLKDLYRWHLMLKGDRGPELRRVLRETLDRFQAAARHHFLLGIDVDPHWML
ncbi:MAG TPA: primosomal protein N' [Spirochaetia bacterium]|nr:primosomal protein N' [Spirochaetia bacterium]